MQTATVGVGEPFGGHRLLRTSDIDEAQQVGARLITENRLRLPREHTFAAHINGVDLDTVSLYYLDYGTQLDVDSAPLKDCFALLVPVTGSMSIQHQGREFEATSEKVAGVISPGEHLRMRWSPNLAVFCIRIDSRAMCEFAGSVLRNTDDRALRFDPIMARPAAVDAVLATVRLIADVWERAEAPAGPHPHVVARLREQLMATLLLAHPNTYSDLLVQQPLNISRGVVRQAMEMIEANPASAPTVASIAQRIGISLRTLQIGFQRELGKTPAAYLREVRLSRARSELLTSGPRDGTTIADVASRWGFTHLGRFARYYREAYNENPSESLHGRMPGGQS